MEDKKMCGTRDSSLLGKITVFFVICCCSLPTQAKFGGGTGEPNDPYLIYDAEQMNALGADTNERDKHFKLMSDIDLSGFTGTSFNIIGTSYGNPFTGVFDGNGFEILNFNSTASLFGYIDDPNAEVKNLGLRDPNILGASPLVGSLQDGTITGCYVEGGTISGGSGLVGWNNYEGTQGTITNCHAIVEVSGTNYVGGLVGNNSHGIITNCRATASVSGNYAVGGLVGGTHRGTISNCYSAGDVSGWKYVGGLVGYNSGAIINSYATGSVMGNEYVGGLVGVNNTWVISSFWDIETSGQSEMCGSKGTSAIGCDNAHGKTTVEMKTMSTFTDPGWDFVGESANGTEDIWWILEGLDYPRLWWETPVFAEVRIVPRTINLASKGKLTCYIWPPEEYNVADIDYDSVLLNNKIQPVSLSIDEQKQVAIAKFSRPEVQSILNIGQVEMRITGRLTDRTMFKGTDTVKILDNSYKRNVHRLVAHWKFDDGSGSTAIDSARKNDGILLGDPVWTTGVIDGALSFDGDGDYVAVNSIDVLAGDTFTVQSWICVSEFAGIWNPVLTQHDLNNNGYYFYVASSRPSFYIVEGSNFVQAVSPETIKADQWYPVAVTNDGSTLNLYVNGLLKATASSIGLTGAIGDAFIGCEITTSFCYTGLIDDIRIYDRALTADGIAMLAY